MMIGWSVPRVLTGAAEKTARLHFRSCILRAADRAGPSVNMSHRLLYLAGLMSLWMRLCLQPLTNSTNDSPELGENIINFMAILCKSSHGIGSREPIKTSVVVHQLKKKKSLTNSAWLRAVIAESCNS